MGRSHFVHLSDTNRLTHGTPFYIRAAGIFLCTAFLLPGLLSGCGTDDSDSKSIAAYGDYGSSIAETLAADYPYRKAFSQSEKDAGAYVKSEFEKLGYTVEEQTFPSADNTGTSTNYIVRIPGEGMMFLDEGQYKEEHRQVIVGAHYDTLYGEEDAAAVPDFDGIQDNASGIGCLLTVAKQLKTVSAGYDVILVAFGAGDASYAGAAAFAAQMTPDEISSTDAMYCIESIYAGDKLYANSGWNSLVAGQKYAMRRKLYEAYDVVYENQLSSINGVDLLYNECGQSIDVDGDGAADIYREVTMTVSDYVPFDRAGIPVVFFESYDYNFSTVMEMKETKNLLLQANGGLIRRTDYDSTETLKSVMTEGQLQTRINNTAFIIFEAIKKGAHDSLSKSEYAGGATLVPTISVTATVTPAEAAASAAS